jgi:hypothetical protein
MTVVVSDEEKAHVMRQVGIGKASVSEPLMKRRNNQDDIRTGEFKSLRDEPGGCPLIGQAVSGVKAARARSAALARNVGRRVPTLHARALVAWVGERERVVRRKPETLSTDAVPAGGPARSSGEALVMGVERRGRLIGELFARATGIVPGGDEWASQVWQKSRLRYRNSWCGRRIRESRPTRVPPGWIGSPSPTSRSI